VSINLTFRVSKFIMQRNKFHGLYQLNRVHKINDFDQQRPAKYTDIATELAGSVNISSNDDSLEYTSITNRQVQKQHFNTPVETESVPRAKKELLKNHVRSQSCPFDLSDKLPIKKLHHRSPSAIPEEPYELTVMAEQSEAGSIAIQNKKLARITQKGLPFAKKKSSQSMKSVVIHNNDSNPIFLSSMLYS
jgi:hypothetical protein